MEPIEGNMIELRVTLQQIEKDFKRRMGVMLGYWGRTKQEGNG